LGKKGVDKKLQIGGWVGWEVRMTPTGVLGTCRNYITQFLVQKGKKSTKKRKGFEIFTHLGD